MTLKLLVSYQTKLFFKRNDERKQKIKPLKSLNKKLNLQKTKLKKVDILHLLTVNAKNKKRL